MGRAAPPKVVEGRLIDENETIRTGRRAVCATRAFRKSDSAEVKEEKKRYMKEYKEGGNTDYLSFLYYIVCL